MDLNGLAPIRKLDIGMLRQALKTDNLTSDEKQAKSQSSELLPEIFRLLASLEDDTQKMLLDSWAKLEMPLNEKTVSNLLQYLDSNPALNTEDKMAVIKAFAFLESNGLPFSEKLVDALRSIFNNNGNLSSNLEQYLNSNNSMNQEQLNNLLSQLDLTELRDSLTNIDNFSQQTQEYLNQEAAASSQNINAAADSETAQNISAAAQNPDSEINTNLNLEFLNNFSNLDQEIKNMILNNLDSLAKNFDENTIKVLNNFMAGNSTGSSEKMAVLKAFSFLENNQLPLSENLITEMSNNFQQEDIAQFVENINNKGELFSNLTSQNSALVSENETAVELNAGNQELARSLADQSKISDQLLSLFNKTGGKNEKKIADNILGQKLVNIQQQEQNTPLMLALEIPVKLEENKLSSLLLKVEKEEGNQNQAASDEDTYNISFILEFENIGPIQSKININQKNINTDFFTESAETAELIQNNFPHLRTALQNIGFNINNVRIKNFENFEEEKNNFFNNLILSELNERDEEGKYRHIDIKI